MNSIRSVLLNPVPMPPKGIDSPFLLICIALVAVTAFVGAALLISTLRRKK